MIYRYILKNGKKMYREGVKLKNGSNDFNLPAFFK